MRRLQVIARSSPAGRVAGPADRYTISRPGARAQGRAIDQEFENNCGTNLRSQAGRAHRCLWNKQTTATFAGGAPQRHMRATSMTDRRNDPSHRSGSASASGGGRPSVVRSLLTSMMVGLGAAALFSRNRPGAAQRGRDGRTRGRRGSDGVAGQHDRGRSATAPQEIPAKGWKDILWRVWGEIQKDRILAVAAGVTFYALLALFPAIAAFVSDLRPRRGCGDHQPASRPSCPACCPGGALDVIGEQVKRISARAASTLSLTPGGQPAALAVERQCRHQGDDRRAQRRLRRGGEARLHQAQLVSLAFTLGAHRCSCCWRIGGDRRPADRAQVRAGTDAEVLVSSRGGP